MSICFILHQLCMTPVKIYVLNVPPTTNHETACKFSRPCVDSAKREKPRRHVIQGKCTRTRKVKNNTISSAIARDSEDSQDLFIEIAIFPIRIAPYISRPHDSAIEESGVFIIGLKTLT